MSARCRLLVACVAVATTLVACNSILGIRDPIDQGATEADSSATEDAIDTSIDGSEAASDTTAHDTPEVPADSETTSDSSVDAPDTNDATPPADADADAGCVSKYVEEVSKDTPLAYWHLDETGGSTAKDAMGAHDGSYSGGGLTLGVGAAIKCGTAVHFVTDGGGSMTAVVPGFDGLATFSVEAWIAVDKTDFTPRFVLGRWAGSNGWALFNDDVGAADFFRADASTSNQAQADVLVETVYTHFVATYDGTNLVLYEMGVQKATVVSTVAIAADTVAFALGTPGAASSTSGGSFDEVAIYDHALGSDRVAAHFVARGD